MRAQGVRKPAKEAYERVLQHLGLPPGDVLFVDDRKVNVQVRCAPRTATPSHATGCAGGGGVTW